MVIYYTDYEYFLHDASAERKKEIVQLWHIQDVKGQLSNSQLMQHVLKQSQNLNIVRSVWEQLSADERTILNAVLRKQTSSYSRLTEKDLMLQTTLSLKSFQKGFEHLQYLALLHKTSSGKTTIVSTMYEWLPQLTVVAGEIFSLSPDKRLHLLGLIATFAPERQKRLLEYYHMSWAETFADIDIKPLFLAALASISDPLPYLDGLEPEVVDVYTWLRQQITPVPVQRLRTRSGLSEDAVLKIIQALEDHALAFDSFQEQERMLYLLRDLKNRSSSVTRPSEAEDVPALVSSPSAIILNDLARVVNFVYQQIVEPTKDGALPKRIHKKLEPLLSGKKRNDFYQENQYPDMLFGMAYQLGLIELMDPPENGGKERFVPGRHLDAWRQLTREQQTLLLVALWLKDPHWFDRVGAHYKKHPASYYSADYVDASKVRQILFKYLQSFSPGRWYRMDALLDLIWEQDHTALHPYQYSKAKAERKKGSETYEKWRTNDAERYIGALSSSLHEMGLIALGYVDPQIKPDAGQVNADFFQLTDLAAAVFNPFQKEVWQQQAPVRSLIVQPNFEIMVLQPDYTTLYRLLPFTQADTIDTVSRLTITRTSLLHGLESGLTLDEILQILSEHSQKELAQNVLYTLRDWAKSYKEVSIAQVLLVEAQDEAAGEVIAASKNLKAFNMRRVSPTIFLCSTKKSLADLKRALEKEEVFVRLQDAVS